MILLNSGRSRRGFSRIGRFLQCPQKFAYAQVLRVEEKTDAGQGPPGHTRANPALAKGSLIHLGLAHYYARVGAYQGGVVVDATTIPPTILNTATSTLPGAVIVSDPEAFYTPADAMRIACERDASMAPHLDMALYCVDSYLRERGQADADLFRIVAVEVEHSTVLGTLDCPGHAGHGLPLEYSARIDLVWADAAGRIMAIDHKTSGRIQASSAAYYSRHGQFFGLDMLGRKTYGAVFDGVRLNCVQTDGMKFTRPSLEPNPWALSAFADRILEAEHAIARLELRTSQGNLSPWKWPAADNELVCYHRYGKCEFWDLCAWGPAALADANT